MRSLIVALSAAATFASRLEGVHRISMDDVARFAGECPCSNVSLCDPITITHDKEVFGFLAAESGPASNASWVNLDWTQVTTVAWDSSPELICEAHKHGVRVVANSKRFAPTLNQTVADEWAAKQVEMVKGTFLDGMVFDYEFPIYPTNTDTQAGLTNMVKTATDALHEAIPTSQTSVCVPFVPNHDNRYYDYKGLADASDLFYIMFYDTRSSIYDQCIAGPNAALPLAKHALDAYGALGIPKNKTILGVPWYAKDYTCLPGTDSKAEFCKIPDEPGYRGAKCSAIYNSQEIHYKDYMAMIDSGNTTTGRLYNNATDSPYFNYIGADSRVHQVWMDDAESLTKKYALVKSEKIRGTGPFQFFDLDYSTDKTRAEAQSMWDALKVFTGK